MLHAATDLLINSQAQDEEKLSSVEHDCLEEDASLYHCQAWPACVVSVCRQHLCPPVGTRFKHMKIRSMVVSARISWSHFCTAGLNVHEFVIRVSFATLGLVMGKWIEWADCNR